MPNKVEYLVVDTSAFIKNAQLHEIGTNILTVEEVVNEIKDKRQLRRLVVLPYDLQLKNVFPENIITVTEFSKKTGDYPSLSATDLKVLALTYQLEKEHVGSEHLKTEPTCPKTIELTNHSLLSATDIAGFYMPKKGDGNESEEEGFIGEEESEGEEVEEEEEREGVDEGEGDWEVVVGGVRRKDGEEDEGSPNNLEQQMEGLVLERVASSEEDDEDDEEEESGYEGDDGGWIGPWNVQEKRKGMAGGGGGGEADQVPTVACLTTDFAMQNVLKQMGLKVVTLDGMLINQIRTYILRCYACFKTTSIMTKVFCPKCGNKTLKRVGVTVDPDGTQRIHINTRRPLTARGKRFSLPKPEGGKHAMNPILCEDQRIPQQRITKLALKKNNPLDPDYIAGFSPFTVRDVNSKSAMLGLQRRGEFKYWMRKNPNEVVKNRKKK